MNKLKRFLIFHDWIWSVALAFAAYLIINFGPPQVFNTPMAYFTINWMQPLIATAGIMAGLFAITRLGLWFNMRKLHKYLYGKKNKSGTEHTYFNPSYADLKNILPWQRLLFLAIFLLSFFFAALLIFLSIMPLSPPA